MLKLYSWPASGNCHKVRLLLGFLDLRYEEISVNIPGGEQKHEPFLKINPLGQIPVLVDSETIIRDSQAILVYLARRQRRDDWLPIAESSLARIMQWLSVAANEIHHGPNLARQYYLNNNKTVDITSAEKRSHSILSILNDHLASRQWLECARPTIADIACFPYIGLIHQAHISLDEYENVAAWVQRIKELPGFVSMPGL